MTSQETYFSVKIKHITVKHIYISILLQDCLQRFPTHKIHRIYNTHYFPATTHVNAKHKECLKKLKLRSPTRKYRTKKNKKMKKLDRKQKQFSKCTHTRHCHTSDGSCDTTALNVHKTSIVL